MNEQGNHWQVQAYYRKAGVGIGISGIAENVGLQDLTPPFPEKNNE